MQRKIIVAISFEKLPNLLHFIIFSRLRQVFFQRPFELFVSGLFYLLARLNVCFVNNLTTEASTKPFLIGLARQTTNGLQMI